MRGATLVLLGTWRPYVPPVPRLRPFLSADLDEYLRRYWAIVFTVAARPIETGHMRYYLSWYCTRLKVVELDHHLYADTLRHSLLARTGTSELPVLFVNAKYVGTIDEVKSLEERRLLKDMVQFGFRWQTGAAVGGAPQSLHTLPSAYNDTELFRGRYRGTPATRPVMQLPTLHPFHDGDAKHPSLAFYKDMRAVRLHEAPRAGGPAQDTLLVMALHQALLPPSRIGSTTEQTNEYYAQQVASEAGMELLRHNWRLLLHLLFPYVDATRRSTVEDDEERRRDASPSPPIASAETCTSAGGLSLDELRAMREPGTMDRVHYSYIVFLRFFGWRMHDDQRGVLDRHRRWRERYDLLARPDAQGDATGGAEEPQYGRFDFYGDALPVILRTLLDLGFFTYAVRLVEFIIEEMQCGRLAALHTLVAHTLLPMVQRSPHLDPSHKQRLQRHLHRLSESDSD